MVSSCDGKSTKNFTQLHIVSDRPKSQEKKTEK
jgi:hypothetical protein